MINVHIIIYYYVFSGSFRAIFQDNSSFIAQVVIGKVLDIVDAVVISIILGIVVDNVGDIVGDTVDTGQDKLVAQYLNNSYLDSMVDIGFLIDGAQNTVVDMDMDIEGNNKVTDYSKFDYLMFDCYFVVDSSKYYYFFDCCSS